ASILVAGIGGLNIVIPAGDQSITITGTAVAMILGILLNLILKEKKEDKACPECTECAECPETETAEPVAPAEETEKTES
ncbi:MAG: hypothetical protein IJ317_03030, partial [Clostridia bacterium]|nr:hypothetical protein [Clostridia bacterium]